MHFFMRTLTMAGDGERLFVARRVCKRWKAFIDAMDNGHWAIMHACTVVDPTLRGFLLRRSSNLYENAYFNVHSAMPSTTTSSKPSSAASSSAAASTPVAGESSDMKAAFIEAVQGHGREPGMFLVLGLCKQVAITAVCTPMRFSRAFDNELRGLSYYAVWLCTRVRGDSTPHQRYNTDHLLEWWREAVYEVCEHIERRYAHRPSAERTTAYESLVNFVTVMGRIPFYALPESRTAESNYSSRALEWLPEHVRTAGANGRSPHAPR